MTTALNWERVLLPVGHHLNWALQRAVYGDRPIVRIGLTWTVTSGAQRRRQGTWTSTVGSRGRRYLRGRRIHTTALTNGQVYAEQRHLALRSPSPRVYSR